MQRGPQQEGAAALQHRAGVHQHAPHVGMDDDRVGRAVGVLRPGQRAALQAFLGELRGGLVGGLALRQALQRRRRAAPRSSSRTSGRGRGSPRRPASRSPPRGSSRRWRCRGCPSSPRGRAHWTLLRAPGLPSASGRNFGTMKRLMPRVPAGAPSMRASTRWMMFSAQVVLAGRDPDLLAADLVGAVACGHRLGAHQAQVGAALRLGEVHGAAPLAGRQLGQVERPSARRSRRRGWRSRRRGSGRVHGERHVGRRAHLARRPWPTTAGRPWPPYAGLGAQRRPAALDELADRPP